MGAPRELCGCSYRLHLAVLEPTTLVLKPLSKGYRGIPNRAGSLCLCPEEHRHWPVCPWSSRLEKKTQCRPQAASWWCRSHHGVEARLFCGSLVAWAMLHPCDKHLCQESFDHLPWDLLVCIAVPSATDFCSGVISAMTSLTYGCVSALGGI